MRGSPALAAYLSASRLAGPIARLVLAQRAAAGREDPTRLGERLGRPSRARPTGRLVWLHGASIGEGLSMLPLIAELRSQSPDLNFLATTGTVASAQRMAEVLPEGCLHQCVPVDTAGAVRRFLKHWRPDLAVWVESEFWPRLMVETARRGTPMMLVNARISARSVRRWSWAPGMAATLVGLFRRIAAQDSGSAARLVTMGAAPERVRNGGNLKALGMPPGCDVAELDMLCEVVARRPVWLAAATHAPEEAAVAQAHRAAARKLPGLLCILAPRHPERSDAIDESLSAQGLRVARRGDLPEPETDVWLADTLGEIGLWLRLAPVAFIGGSLAPLGGHNPFEAAALGSAILHGPQTSNFAPAYAALDAAGGARCIADGAALGAVVTELFGSDETRRRMTAAAAEVRAGLAPDVAELAREALALIEPQA